MTSNTVFCPRFGKPTACSVLFAVLFLLSPLAFAAGPTTPGQGIDVVQMLQNLQTQIPYFNVFLSWFAYVGGTYLIFGSVYRLKEYGEQRMQSSGHTDLRKIMAGMFVGAALLYLPVTIETSMTTVFGSDTVTAYQQGSTGWDDLLTTIISIVQFVGAVAIVRGLFQLHKAGSAHAQPDNFTKGIVHIIGGIVALNIVGASHILFTTLGID